MASDDPLPLITQALTRAASVRLPHALTERAQRWRWAALPLTMALGARAFLFVFTQVALRLVAPNSEPNMLKIWTHYDAAWYFSIVEYGYFYPGRPDGRSTPS